MIKPVVNFSFSQCNTSKKHPIFNQANPICFRGEVVSASVSTQLSRFKGPLGDALHSFKRVLKPLRSYTLFDYIKNGEGTFPLQKGNISVDGKALTMKLVQNLRDRVRETVARFTSDGVLSHLTLSEKNNKGLLIRKFEATNAAKSVQSYDYFLYQYQHVTNYDSNGNPAKSYVQDGNYTFYGHDGRAVR